MTPGIPASLLIYWLGIWFPCPSIMKRIFILFQPHWWIWIIVICVGLRNALWNRPACMQFYRAECSDHVIQQRQSHGEIFGPERLELSGFDAACRWFVKLWMSYQCNLRPWLQISQCFPLKWQLWHSVHWNVSGSGVYNVVLYPVCHKADSLWASV